MPRPNTGPKLVFERPKDYARPLYFIRWYENRNRRERATGTDDRGQAEKTLADFIAERQEATRPAGPRHPHQITVAEILGYYGDERAPQVIDGGRIGYAIDALLPFWGNQTADAVKGETCRRYYRERRAALSKKFPARAAKSLPSPVDGNGPACFDGTIRRELGTIAAALSHCAEEGYLINPPDVWLPPKRPSRQDWLTRKQAAQLVHRARSDKRCRHHLPLFILVGLYMGQRKEAILNLQWMPNFTGGWVDIDAGVIHWRAEMEVESNKQRPRSPIPKRLMRFLRYQRKRTRQFVFERQAIGNDGKLRYQAIGDIKHAFATAACEAGMGTLEKVKRKRKQRESNEVFENIAHADITPHVLRHTCITWLLQRGVPIREVAGFVGATEEMIEKTYGHHHPDHMMAARTALD